MAKIRSNCTGVSARLVNVLIRENDCAGTNVLDSAHFVIMYVFRFISVTLIPVNSSRTG